MNEIKMKYYEEQIEKTREKLQSRWIRQGETKVKVKREPYVFDFEETEDSDSIDEKSIEDFAKILFDWKKKGKSSGIIKLNDKDMVLYCSGYTNGRHCDHYLMTLNAYAFWFEVGMYQTYEHPRGKGFYKINNNEQRLRVSKDVLMFFSRRRKDDFCNFKNWIEERKFWSKT